MAESTRERYRHIIKNFTNFLNDSTTTLESITPTVIIKFKNARHKTITGLKQSRGGASIALDIAVLHRAFRLAVDHGLMPKNPIQLKKESKPGKNPTNGARPFTSDELSQLRKAMVWKQKGQAKIDDTLVFLLLRWTGLRRSDAVRLRWEHVKFKQGTNGEIEILTQKREKLAQIPLCNELRTVLEAEHQKRNPEPDEHVLLNPATQQPFSSATRLTERCKALGVRAKVKRCVPHFFRDTFACDMLAKGVGVYEVAQMLADTVETVEEYYAQFVPAARNSVQSKMDSGIGIEEQGKIAEQRGKKVVGFRRGAVR